MPTDELAELDATAEAYHLDRSKLIMMGLKRCLRDGAWQPTGRMQAAGSDPVSPPHEVVVLSNVLMGIAMAFKEAVAGRKRPSKALLDAASKVEDAQRMLAQLLEDLECS